MSEPSCKSSSLAPKEILQGKHRAKGGFLRGEVAGGSADRRLQARSGVTGGRLAGRVRVWGITGCLGGEMGPKPKIREKS